MVNVILWVDDLTKSFNLRLNWWSFLSKPPKKKHNTSSMKSSLPLPEQNPPPSVFNGPRDFFLAQKINEPRFVGTVQGHQHAICNDNNDAQQKELKSIVVWYTLTFQQSRKELLLDRDTPPPWGRSKTYPTYKWKRKKSSWNMSWIGISY